MFWLLAILAYLLGSLSFAILLSRLTGNPDPRMSGSGNAGATNMLRLAGRKLAILTLLGDLCKGLLPVLIASAMGLSLQDQAWIGVCAVIGHLFPLYFRFRGGKGVATALGVLLALQPWLALATAATWLIVALVTRYSSLAAILAAIFAPFYYILGDKVAWRADALTISVIVFISVLLLARHRENIARLLAGKESRIGSKKK